MRFSRTAAVLALAGAGSASELVERQSSCASLHLVIAGGCNLPCPVDTLGYLDTTISNITAAFPDADQYLVPYDDDAYQARESGPIMIAAIEQYVTQCPNTPIVMVGYSVGGIIMMNALCGQLPVSYKSNIIASIVYGEETYNYPASYDTGTCTTYSPKGYERNVSTCAAYADVIQDYCDAQDPACCVGGTNVNYHFTYPDLYNTKAVQFIQSKYAAYGSSAPSSSVPSSTAPSSYSVSATPSSSSSTMTPPSYTTTTMTTTMSSSTMSSSVIVPPYSAAPTTSSAPMTMSTSSSAVAPLSTSSAPVTSVAPTSTLPPHSTYSVQPYTGAAAPNFIGAASYVQAFVAIAIVAAL